MLEVCKPTFQVHSAYCVPLTFAIIFSPLWNLKAMNKWCEQYVVVVRRTSISCMLELVVVRLATISSVCILKRIRAMRT